jgi:hypothetical protein
MHRRHHGITGPPLLFLQGELQEWISAQRHLHGFRLISDNHNDRFKTRPDHGIHSMRDHRQTRHRVQDLGLS